MQIVENRELLLRLRNPKRVTDVVKDTKSLQDGKVLVHWNLENAQKLTEMEVKVESPIIRDYKFTGMFDPFEHQKKTASFLSLRKRAFCFNEQGTGKTASAIWACDYLMNEDQIDRVLIAVSYTHLTLPTTPYV